MICRPKKLAATEPVEGGVGVGEDDATLIESAWVAVCAVVAASVAFTVKELWPAALGVPPIAPVDGFNESPAGNVPVLTLQVYGVVPPDAARVAL